MDGLGSLFLIKGIIIGSIYALISLGFNVIYRTTGVLNFAQGEFLMVGGIVAGWSFGVLQLPLIISLLAGLTAAVVTGMLIDGLAIRPVRNATPVTHVIITIGASIIIRSIVSLVWGTEPFHIPVLKEGAVNLAGAAIDHHSLLIVAIASACMLLLAAFFRGTTTGRAMKACAENPEAARLCGVSIGRMSTVSFGLSALLGGIGGLMVTPLLSMSFDQGTMLGLKGFAAAILGGMGNPVGGVVGGIVLGVLEQYSCWFSSVYQDTLALGLVVLILIVRPRGLLSR